MDEQSQFKENSQAVQSHLTILQSVIQRMAANSSSSKAWCVTLVSAILVIVADKGKPQYAWLALIPTILFLLLDAYYLSLERGFRNAYNAFIKKLHEHSLQPENLFVVVPQGGMLRLFFLSLISFSVWPFYITLAGMIYAAKALVI
jgi:hypothetical protein